jgi:hypothetical protein
MNRFQFEAKLGDIERELNEIRRTTNSSKMTSASSDISKFREESNIRLEKMRTVNGDVGQTPVISLEQSMASSFEIETTPSPRTMTKLKLKAGSDRKPPVVDLMISHSKA